MNIVLSTGMSEVFPDEQADVVFDGSSVKTVEHDGSVSAERSPTVADQMAARSIATRVGERALVPYGGTVKLLYATLDGFCVFVFIRDPQPRRILITRVDAPTPLAVCATLSVPVEIPLTDTTTVIAWTTQAVEALRAQPTLTWGPPPDELIAAVMVAQVDPAYVAAQLAAIGQ